MSRARRLAARVQRASSPSSSLVVVPRVVIDGADDAAQAASEAARSRRLWIAGLLAVLTFVWLFLEE